MAKKKETIQDILDRINEDIETIREKVEELESEVEDSEFEDEDEEQWLKDSQRDENSGYPNKSGLRYPPFIQL